MVGDCSGDTSVNPDDGDVVQPTQNGLLVWRPDANWTGFTDGETTWVNGPCGLQSRSNAERFPWENGGPCEVRLDEVRSVQTSRAVVALTFDTDGILGSTPDTLDALRSRGVHATFFVTGSFARDYPDVVRQMVEDGHELGNHTFNHPYLTRISDADIRAQLDLADGLIQQAAGVDTKPLMRVPFGARDARVLAAIRADGYRSIYWSIDPSDYLAGISPQTITDRILSKVAPGSIVLDHCAKPATAEALPAILDGLAERGLTPVTVSDLLRDE